MYDRVDEVIAGCEDAAKEFRQMNESSARKRAKVVFYQFFNGVAGLRFKKREDFDIVVDALVDAVIEETIYERLRKEKN